VLLGWSRGDGGAICNPKLTKGKTLKVFAAAKLNNTPLKRQLGGRDDLLDGGDTTSAQYSKYLSKLDKVQFAEPANEEAFSASEPCVSKPKVGEIPELLGFLLAA
jgi:hypothetical protein